MEAVQYSMEWTLELNEILDGTKLTTKLFNLSELKAILYLLNTFHELDFGTLFAVHACNLWNLWTEQ